MDFSPPLALSGSILGAGDEGFAEWSKTQEGPRAAVQPSAYWISAHPLWDANGWHSIQKIHFAKSDGK